MGHVEQIPAPVLSMDEANQEIKAKENNKTIDKKTDTTILGGWKNWKENWKNIVEPEEATKKSNEIINNPGTRKQVNLLKQIWKKYNNWELVDTQKTTYENLMKTIQTELDRDIPTVVEMNKEIDINYYMKHPKQAEKKANEIVNDYNNMNSAQLVYGVVSRRKYLSPESQKKLKSVVNSVCDTLDKDAKYLLKNKKES